MPRHTRTRKVTALITTAAVVPAAALAPPFTLLTPPAGPRAADAGPRAGGRGDRRLPEGPSLQQRERSRFIVVALAHGEDGTTGRGIVRGGDVYGLTAVSAVHAASLVAAEGYDRAGALSPASAFEPAAFLDALEAHGVASSSSPPREFRRARVASRQMEGFGGLFGDPDELQRRMAELAESMQGQQKLAWADNAIKLAVDLTVAAINRVDVPG